MERHDIAKVRHGTRRRMLTVASVAELTPRMVRIGFVSDDFGDFASLSPDDHVKLFFPVDDGDAAKRDFTPRSFDVAAGTLVIDFALHEAGPAIAWARQAAVGQQLEIGGPRGSSVVRDDFDWYLLIGDETALPAIGRRVEELRPGVPVTTMVVVANAGETQSFVTAAAWTPIWALRSAGVADDARLLLDALRRHDLPPGDGFVWIGAETGVARTLRVHLTEERGHPAAWIKAAGYWKRGVADSHETIEG